MKKMPIFTVAALAAVLMTGCSLFHRSDMPLAGTPWKPVTLTDMGGAKPADGARAELMIAENGRVSGCGGVNRLGGQAEISGSSLKFGQFFSTMMAGPELPYEDAFKKALAETRSYSISGDTLSLFDADGKLLATFQAAPATENDTK